MLLGAFCVIALLVTGVLGCIGRSPLDAFAARSAKPVPLTPMEQAQKDLAGVTVTYQFGDQSEVLDSDRILSWLQEKEDGSVAIDEQQAKAFVKELAEKYDTAYTTRTFHTTGAATSRSRRAITAGASTRRPRRSTSWSCSPPNRVRSVSRSTHRRPRSTPRTTGARPMSKSA